MRSCAIQYRVASIDLLFPDPRVHLSVSLSHLTDGPSKEHRRPSRLPGSTQPCTALWTIQVQAPGPSSKHSSAHTRAPLHMCNSCIRRTTHFHTRPTITHVASYLHTAVLCTTVSTNWMHSPRPIRPPFHTRASKLTPIVCGLFCGLFCGLCSVRLVSPGDCVLHYRLHTQRQT